MKGLYKSIYGKIDSGKVDAGIYPNLYSHYGSTSQTKRMDIRLGNYEFGQAEEDEEEETEFETSAEDTSGKIELPEPPGGVVTGPSVFAQEKEGFPMWIVGVFILGFALAWRQRKKKATSA